MIDGPYADPKAPPLDLLGWDMHLPKSDGEEILKRLRSTVRHVLDRRRGDLATADKLPAACLRI